MEYIPSLVELIIIIWLLVKVNDTEKSIKNISEYIEILTKNQKAFFESQMKEIKLQETECVNDKRDTFTYKLN